ncbi:hypothetical protein V497_07347 [Pseudogymnoascus sp. VKM F-4516 (FW-969)]|nr:hypothetical protein V497_07347 [Pseudogymnoascus sp. VKM F-4516 (FW-969)]
MYIPIANLEVRAAATAEDAASSPQPNCIAGGSIAGIVIGCIAGTLLLVWLWTSLRGSRSDDAYRHGAVATSSRPYDGRRRRRRHSSAGGRPISKQIQHLFKIDYPYYHPFYMVVKTIFSKLKAFITHPQYLLYSTMAWRCGGTTNAELVENLYRNKIIQTPRVKEAMLKVDRGQYCPRHTSAYEDSPQPIGWRATISAPHMHASALESLFPSDCSAATGYPADRPMRVLDVGSGSGYLTHVMAELVGVDGKVVGIEHIKELAELGRENMGKSAEGAAMLESGKVRFVVGDGRKGWVEPSIVGKDVGQETWDEKGWDAIHVGAGAAHLHDELVAQLRRPGRMFIPVDDATTGIGQHIWVIDKDTNGVVKKRQILPLHAIANVKMAEMSAYVRTETVMEEEKISRYRPGGFHPVALGNSFKEGRYTVVHKLGYGGFSTVWVAYDDILRQWVALKIMTSATTETSREVRWYNTLAECRPDSLASNYIAHLLDKFTIDGPNGTHLCLVFELLGPNVRSIVKSEYQDRDNIDPTTILKMSEQLLKALSFVHQTGFAHGDISTKNMAFTAKSLSKVTKEKLFEVLGAPRTENVARVDGQPLADGIPPYLVKSAPWCGWVNEYDEDFRLLDFGESFVHGKEPEIITQPGGLMPPETVLTEDFDYRVDLWRVGIAIYSFVFGGLPFYCIGDRDNLVIQMIEFLGEIPPEWKVQFDNLRIDFKRQPLLEGDLRVDRGLEYKFRHQVQEEMLQPLLPVIQGLMKFRPSERISALQALELIRSSFMTQWDLVNSRAHRGSISQRSTLVLEVYSE